MLAALGMPSCLTLYFVSHPVPALGTHSGMPGTPFCCLGYRLSHPKSSLMSPYCPVLLEHNVLPLPSHPASFLPWLYLGLSMVFTSKPFHPFSGSKKGQQIRDLQTPTVEEGFLLHTSCFHRLSHPTQVLGEMPRLLGLPKWLSGKESSSQCQRCRRHRFDPWVGKIPWRRKWQSTRILAWRTPWTEEPGGLQSIGSKRVRQDWATEHTHSRTCPGY